LEEYFLEDNTNNNKIGWMALILVALSSFIIALDSTFMNVAITNLVVDLNTTVSAIQIIITVYALTMASLMLLGGKMQDVVGRKNAFLIGAAIYGIGTTIAALSINATMLLIGWSILEGIGAALMTPATASIITGSYSGKNRAFAIGIWTAVASIGAAVGPLIGGFLTTFFSWRWGFGLELVIVIFVLALSHRIKYFPPTMKLSELDKASVLLSSFGILTFVLGILSLNAPKDWEFSLIMMGVGIVLLILFYLREKKIISMDERPFTDIRLFKDRNFTLGNITRMIMQLALAGAVFVLPVFLQQVTGSNAFTTGLAILPLTIGLLVFAIASSRLSDRIAPHYLISIGFLIALVGSFFLSFQFNLNTQISDIIPGTLLIGIGLGLALPITGNLVLSSAPSNKQSDATGILSTSASLGSSMGTAIIGIIFILGIVSGINTAVDQTFPNEFSKDQIKQNLTQYEEKMKTTNITSLKNNQTSIAYKLANITVKNAMKTTFYFVTLIFLIGFLISLYIKPLKMRDLNK
jgi:EmrB/QacA subfamily drug resistance transporter